MDHTSSGNLLPGLPAYQADETFEELLHGADFKLERIVSTGHATPPGQWYDQELDEWVVVFTGSARLRFEDEADDRELNRGDWLHIAAHRRHRVQWTDPDEPTIWLAIHFQPTSSKQGSANFG